MTTVLYVFLLVCCVFFSGCSGARQIQEDQTPKKEAGTMIQIQNFTVTEEALTFDYKVTNPFNDDIRVCQDTSFFGRPHVVTRIDNETVRIKLRFNLERDIASRSPPPIAKYLRLAPGESYSDRILLNLPIRNASPVNSFLREDFMKHKQIILHRVIFEVGYFGSELNQFFDAEHDQIKSGGPDMGKFYIMGGFHYLKTDPLILDEMQDGRLREFVYTGADWSELEASVEVVIADVNVPCSIAVD